MKFLPYGRQSLDARADLFSVMVVMDLPLFHKNRQDRYTAASVAETSAALFERDDMLRRMRSEVELHAATLQRQQERGSGHSTCQRHGSCPPHDPCQELPGCSHVLLPQCSAEPPLSDMVTAM